MNKYLCNRIQNPIGHMPNSGIVGSIASMVRKNSQNTDSLSLGGWKPHNREIERYQLRVSGKKQGGLFSK